MCWTARTTAQQKRFYSLLVLALPEAALHVFRKVERKSVTAGNDAWEALLHRYEHDGIHRRGDLLNALDEKQRPEETCMDFFNRLVDLQAQLGRFDEEVPDRRLVMNIIRGLRPEYAAMTDTINERDSAVTVEFMETLLATTGQRIERRLGEQREPKPAATAFPASGEEPEDLRTMMQKLKQEVAAPATSRRRNGGGSEFKGACWVGALRRVWTPSQGLPQEEPAAPMLRTWRTPRPWRFLQWLCLARAPRWLHWCRARWRPGCGWWTVAPVIT